MNKLTTYRHAIANKFGLTANHQSIAYTKGYEDGTIASQNGTLIEDFPIDFVLSKASSYAWGYYDGFVDN